ncbi:uncharacterized protein ACA1_154270 [Acanthamoeba castellanii str. Neff]|uniref:Uncharacterized protein n=1 Tax=Acanthamoeba castellanii (strain ATCC 30010 / Neff) TaxID=1257118 RepID=L8GZ69_ACACF|nr:uncharacterized protein ACA1_154270 [Acanthamoeba castellanii str. Neff]ELR18544.1 hypothetical protein ACA1_154270 [Acanthamoeba castellanii str. Neff]
MWYVSQLNTVAYLGTGASTTCPMLKDHLCTYEQLYINTIKTLDKHDHNFCTGAILPSTQIFSVHQDLDNFSNKEDNVNN